MNLPHWVSIASDGVPEFYMDHTMLSSARMCESRFMLDHVENYRSLETPWALDFGQLFHSAIEWYYKAQMDGSYSLKGWLEYSTKLWDDQHFEQYNHLPQSKAVGGRIGFITLLGQYHHYYATAGDNLKPIALEIGFGKNKEVPILEDASLYSYAPFRLYLSGRMDFIFDDGRRIGPMDHKTFSMSGKNPMTTYEVQEGMTGYIYAMNFLYKKLKASNPDLNFERETNVLWLNFIMSKLEGDLNKRFQRVPLYKTQEQLEDYRLRQISTGAKIYQLLFKGRPPDYNASVCTNYWHSVCPYQKVHRLANKSDQLIVLGKDFKKEVWNPEQVKKS